VHHNQRSFSNADLEKIKKQDDAIGKSIIFEQGLNGSGIQASPVHVAKIK